MISVHVIKHVRNDDSVDLSVFCLSAWPLLRAWAEVNDLGSSAGLLLRAGADVNDLGPPAGLLLRARAEVNDLGPSAWLRLRAGAEVNDLGPSAGMLLRARAKLAIQAGFPCIQAGIQLECKEILLERGARNSSRISVHSSRDPA